MSWDCNDDRLETTQERFARLEHELKREQEIAEKRRADELERCLNELRRENEKHEIDDRF